MKYKINHANIKEWAANYDGEPFDAILCDPPYELGFMGKSWDSSGIAFDKDMWADLFKLVKPGGHLLAFSGSRTYHRMAVAIEDAGFEIRDMIEWVYGSGFPKSLNIGKAVDKINGKDFDTCLKFTDYLISKRGKYSNSDIDKLLGLSNGAFHFFAKSQSNHAIPRKEHYLKLKGILSLDDEWDWYIEEAEREIVGTSSATAATGELYGSYERGFNITKGTSPYEGYGTALKPAHEPICLARKPLEGTVANNVLKYGTGGLNIDGTRVQSASNDPNHRGTRGFGRSSGGHKTSYIGGEKEVQLKEYEQHSGRFPANLIHDGSDEVEAVFPQSKDGTAGKRNAQNGDVMKTGLGATDTKWGGYGNGGSASRFFYTAKASKSERNAGLEGFEGVKKFTAGNYGQSSTCKDCSKTINGTNNHTECSGEFSYNESISEITKNNHPTVKPLSLTKYLATLIKLPTGGRLLVPFSGSGSEMIGALQAGWEYVEGVELTEEYIPIAEARIAHWIKIPVQDRLL